MNKLGLQVSAKFPQAYTLGPQSPKKLLQTDVFSFFRIISVVHLLLQPVAMPDLRENTLLLKWRQLSEINEKIWKATRASLLFERHFSFGSSCNIEERNCAASLHTTPPSRFAGEKHVFWHLSFPARAAFYLTHLLLWRGEVQCLRWRSSLLCFWPHRGDGTKMKWVNLVLGGSRWKGTTGRKIHLSFITFCLKHTGKIRSYIFIVMSWDLGACLEIHARPWIWSETILLWCACTSSIFLWFSPPVIYQWWVSSGLTKSCWLHGFDCEQRAWLKEEQTPDFFPTGRLLCTKNTEGKMTTWQFWGVAISEAVCFTPLIARVLLTWAICSCPLTLWKKIISSVAV